MLRQNKTFLLIVFLVLAFASVALGAAPDLEANAGATLLRIPLGTSGDGVAFDDVWNWDDGGGSSAGDGDVPIDGGGTAKVSTFLTEIVADAVYTIQKDLQFGDGSTSSFFSSKNEMVYFEDGVVFSVTSGATLQLGELSGDWGINGSTWSVGPSGNLDVIAAGSSSASFQTYASVLHIRGAFNRSASVNDGEWIARNTTLSGENVGDFGGSINFKIAIDWKKVFLSNLRNFTLQATPAVFEDVHVHRLTIGADFRASSVATGLKITNRQFRDIEINGSGLFPVLVNPEFDVVSLRIVQAGSELTYRLTANIHISDSAGAPLESATVVMESFGNIVSDDGGSTFYRCTTSHTAGATFAGDSANWTITTAAIAAQAGVDGSNAINGEWITGVDYVKSETLFSVATDASGDIAQQIANYKKWVGTSEALLSYAPYQFTISKTGHVTLSPDLVAPTIIDGTVQPFVEHWQLEAGATSRPRPRRHGN